MAQGKQNLNWKEIIGTDMIATWIGDGRMMDRQITDKFKFHDLCMLI